MARIRQSAILSTAPRRKEPFPGARTLAAEAPYPMQITVESIGPCRKRIQLVVPPDRVKKEVDESLRNAAQNLRLPGFRPGHVPRSIIEKRYGQAIRQDVKESLVQDGYQRALTEHNLLPMGTPKLDLDAVAIDEKEGLKVAIELDTRPEFELTKYRGIAAEGRAVSVSDEDVEEQIREIRSMRSRPVKDDVGAIDANAFALASLQFREGDKVVLTRDSVRLRLGMAIHGSNPEEFQKLLTGKKPGDSFEIGLTFPADFEVADVAGKEGVARVEVREVYRLVPPSDEELLKDLDMPDLETLRGDVRRRIEEAREANERRRVEDELIEKVVAAHPFEIPDRLVDTQVDARIEQHRSHADTPPSDEEIAALRAKLKPEMERGLRRLFVLEALARREKIFVTEDDLVAELRGIAERNQSNVEEVARYYQQQNLLPALRMDLLETKVRSFLYEHATKGSRDASPSS